METLYLLRHGKSSWKDESLSDFDRPLKKRGYEELELLAAYMKDKGYLPKRVICSPARRTVETLETINELLNIDEKNIEYLDDLYLASSEELSEIIEEYFTDGLLLVGHNPGIEDLLSFLIGEDLEMKTSHLAVVNMESKDLIDFIRGREL